MSKRLGAVLAKTRLDPFLLAILCTVGVALLLPASGHGAAAFSVASKLAVGLLFFLYGARLSAAETLRGLADWRLHLTIFGATYVLFPLLGIAAIGLVPWALSQQLYQGLLFLCLLPSTVQSSVAFTSVAGGNVPGAVCSASMSNLVGVFVSPLLITLLLAGGDMRLQGSALLGIVLQLLAPFLAGQLARRWIGGWITEHAAPLKLVDRGSILLVVYTAFSEGVTRGVWHQLSAESFGALIGVCVVLLALMLACTALAGRAVRFDRANRITILFCGSKKSLASGLPMAGALFAGHEVALLILPLMLFHQIQLMACAWLAKRFAERGRQTEARSRAPASSGSSALE